MNGGTCINKLLMYVCDCMPYYGGYNCEHAPFLVSRCPTSTSGDITYQPDKWEKIAFRTNKDMYLVAICVHGDMTKTKETTFDITFRLRYPETTTVIREKSGRYTISTDYTLKCPSLVPYFRLIAGTTYIAELQVVGGDMTVNKRVGCYPDQEYDWGDALYPDETVHIWWFDVSASEQVDAGITNQNEGSVPVLKMQFTTVQT
ncbi:uncharacterized protein LOC125556800 [Nematostella vectensis]|uniref:uncharacterized protein LOC125556800 n=1 Tax=Nematostella vectensis TaxID=45351 RepID=UPI0020778DE8|nr:uncharacterized protein LOC125556800 [Nematostella vectensis]